MTLAHIQRVTMTVAETAAKYGKTGRQVLADIKRGMPAIRTPGARAYLIMSEDAERWYAPTIRSAESRPGKRESERARIERQLRGAGIQ